jgi:predicted NBD/HSP70 family sugar kinase
MIGIELLARGAVALDVDADGRVVRRGEAYGQDVPGAAVAAVSAINTAAGQPVSVASADPHSSDSSAACVALVTACSAVLARERPLFTGTAAAAAEAWTGAARGAHDVVYFGVGDRTVAGVLRDGAPFSGGHGRAPAVAWLALNPVEREDYRKIGCLESEVASAGIVRRLIWRLKAGDRSQVQDAVDGDLGAISVTHVLDAARAGDGVAVSVIRDTARYLGMAAANLVAVVDPDLLVLGGIMASAADLLLEPVRGELARRLPPAMTEALTIAPAALGADAPAIGAVRLTALAVQ